MELTDLKGIGPKRIALFSELGIHTPEDLLSFYPREYLDYSQTVPLRDAKDGERVSICVTAQADPTVYYLKGRYIVSLRVADATGKAVIRWMNQPYRANQYHTGDVLFVNGIVSKKRGTVLYNPQINRMGGGIIPVYESVKGLTQTLIRESVGEILRTIDVSDALPPEWLKRYRLIGYRDALQEIHFPTSAESLREAKRRLSFEELFLYFTAIRTVKDDRDRRNGFAFRTEGLFNDFLARVPFEPTDAQMSAMHQVEEDMRSDRTMNRLIQGDVGSGKTLIAEYALSIAKANGKQGVMLAPTELLAEQHFGTLSKHFPDVCLYVGSMSAKEKKVALECIATGEAAIAVGTHALLSDVVRFKDLGLVITDEQHRFGVLQRARIEAKGIRPDVLVMSATPIPRTLALLVYADLDLSVIDMLPPGRKPIKTHFVPQAKRNDLYRHLAECAKNNERAYVVCPLIEPTEGYEGLSLEELYNEITKLLPDTTIGKLHGQMHESEKRTVMEDFRSGKVPILISTTVVEVGVDVPEATAMVIEGADHFGLATLHQLRGRVGRGEKQAHCYLLAQKLNERAKERIETMIGSSDGFLIAQRDFEMRGSGDLFGVRQSGEGELNGILAGSTVEIIEAASSAADDVFKLPTVLYNVLIERAQKRFRTPERIAHN
ncbi:MAG: ATP-dependent DNA helicase RecG [Clostridia bacterium]|nr:ATP-dependent DNA helicase RecG [Clostridia bacterium]